MKYVILFSFVVGFIATNAVAKPVKDMPVFHGCLVDDNDSHHNPEGSSKLCLFHNQNVLLAGFGFLRVGTYEVDTKHQRIKISYLNPDVLSAYATYDDKIKGTHVQLDNFQDANQLYIQFDDQRIQPVFNQNANCVDYPSVYQSNHLIKNIHLYVKNNNNEIKQTTFTFTPKQNKILIEYAGESQLQDNYLSYQLQNKHHRFVPLSVVMDNGIRHFAKADYHYRLDPFDTESENHIFSEFQFLKTKITTEQNVKELFEEDNDEYVDEDDTTSQYGDKVMPVIRQIKKLQQPIHNQPLFNSTCGDRYETP